MKTFYCDACDALVFFENVSCLHCGHALGFLPDIMDMAALEPQEGGVWKSLAPASQGRNYRQCANGRVFSVCNWFVPQNEPEDFCIACRLNIMVPDASLADTHALWHKIEIAKRRLVYTLRQLSLPVQGGQPESHRLQFRFLADDPNGPPVLTGHENGMITLNIAEADDAEREKRRHQLHEPQRTLVGHFRHESGHFYWDTLIANTPLIERFRTLFGDERADYGEALKAHYANGAAPDWPNRCVSAYASSHPWEDWAETWAHYLHMVDSLQTAAGFGVMLLAHNPAAKKTLTRPHKAFAPGASFDTLLDQWFPLTFALNCLNRGVGLPDLYPFVLPGPALDKLRFVHEVISQAQSSVADTAPEMAAQSAVA